MPETSTIPEWEWDASHTPLPLTPSFGSVYPRWMEEALRVTFREFGMLPAGIEMRLRDGYTFTRVMPVGLPFVPPAWFTRIALRFWWLHPAVVRRVRTAMRRVRDDHGSTLLRRWHMSWRPAIVAEQRRLREARLADLTDDELADHISRLIEQTGRWVTVHFLLHGAISIPLFALDQFLNTRPAAEGIRTDELVQGSSPASSTPARVLRDVAALLHSEPDLVDRAAARSMTDGLTLLQSECRPFAEEFARYLSRFGHGIAGRYEFIVPALGEQPERLLPAVLAAARAGPQAGEQPDQRADRLVDAIASRLAEQNDERRFRELVGAARRAYAVRDDNVQVTFLDAFGLCRIYLLEAGNRLTKRGAISATDDIFFLTVPETARVLRRAQHLSPDLIISRRRHWSAAIENPPPQGTGRTIPLVDFRGLPDEARAVNLAVVRYMREIMAASDVYAEPSGSEAVIRGVGAVRGRYAGIARVLRGEEEFDRLAPGEVLVCEMTSPAWAPVLPLAGALVTDHGGLLSHPAVIAREFGIPAVVATRRGTRLIPDGAVVEVDGIEGVVRILDHDQPRA
ncbi:MAG: PEP-utilizing enzyme [Dehalococcoidia bacterium]